jgi:integrase/recombinase XerD
MAARELQRPVSSKNLHDINNSNNDVNLDRKLDIITAGAKPFVKEHLLTKISKDNCQIIVNYIMAMQTEVSPTEEYRINTILKLKHFAEVNEPKTFRNITRQDFIDFLDSYRKPETVDPLHRWMGTYEVYRISLMRFFRWLYAPDLPPRQRPRPPVIENIPKPKRKEISIYKPTDLWTEEDDALFYRYCPSSRDRCWHAVSRDTGCRPHELLKLKIKDVIAQRLENGYQIARINVNGKTGTRNVRLNNSYPRLKEWLSSGHPVPGNQNAYLFCGVGHKNYHGRRLAPHTINAIYEKYKKVVFPKLLEDPLVPEEDKRKIRDLLKKPWNPYVRRHTAATEISKLLKDSVLIDQYLGWSHTGNTRQKYQHYYADDSFDAMLAIDGIVTPNSKDKMKNLLKPKICPNCDESNKPESKFCVKCKFVLSFDAFNEASEEKARTAKEAEESKKRLEELEAKHEILQANSASVLKALMAIEMGIKSPEVKIITWSSDEGHKGLLEAAAIARAENEAREKKHQRGK